MKYAKYAFAGAAMSILAGCQSGGMPDVYSGGGELIGRVGGGELVGRVGGRGSNVTLSEASDYSTQRSRIYNQPTDCTVTTSEEGKVIGGRTVYTEGTANRECVSEPNRRRRGSQVEQVTRQIEDVTDLIYAGRDLQSALDF